MADSSEADGSDSPLMSRDGSFFSLTSGNSVYVTAPESVASTNGSTPEQKKRNRSSPNIDRRGSVKSNNSTTTLGEGEDTENLWSSVESSLSHNGNEEADDPNTNVTPFKIKEDVSRICNDIAEAIQPDVRKKAQINFALAAKSRDSLSELKRLAISEGGLLSSKYFYPIVFIYWYMYIRGLVR